MVHPYRLANLANSLNAAQDAYDSAPSDATAMALAKAKQARYAVLLGANGRQNQDRRFGGRV